jgi:hypothetical protein
MRIQFAGMSVTHARTTSYENRRDEEDAQRSTDGCDDDDDDYFIFLLVNWANYTPYCSSSLISGEMHTK